MRHGPRDSARSVALTFVDRPGRLTEQVLDALAECRARATFNVLGERVGRPSGLIERIEREGHELGSHAFDHDRLAGRPLRAYRQLARTNAALRAAT